MSDLYEWVPETPFEQQVKDEAIITIEQLRQRVTELKSEVDAERQRRWDGNADSSREIAELSREIAALKQAHGEPVAWRYTDGEDLLFTDSASYAETKKDAVALYEKAPTIPDGWQLVPVEAIEQINKWADAYPIDIFPEPDWKDVADKLGNSGVLDCVSAANMRHVITKVKDMLSAAPKPEHVSGWANNAERVKPEKKARM